MIVAVNEYVTLTTEIFLFPPISPVCLCIEISTSKMNFDHFE